VGIRTCSAEDLIVYKAFADRPRDWIDVEGVLLRQQGRLDLELVFAELTPLSPRERIPGDCAQVALADRPDGVNLGPHQCPSRRIML
jgi:hypothetical protein